MIIRHTIAFLLFLSLCAQCFFQAAIVLSYYAGAAAYAKNCINKNKPMLHCNGQCQMMKKLKEQEKKEQQNPERKQENKNGVISSRSFFITLEVLKLAKVKSFTFYISVGLKDRSYSIFHPPHLA